MSKKSVFYIGFFTVLVVVFYFSILSLTDLGKKKITTISYVRPFSFTDQDGKKFTEKDMEGKVCVVEYFFTTCTGICPIMNGNMKKVYDQFKNENSFLIVSHTSDPKTDSVAKLKSYANSLGVSGSKWMFLTGRKDSLYNMARVSYVIDDPKNNLKNIDDQFIHSQNWALVDKNGKIRAIYDGLKEAEVNELIEKIKELLKE
jgi:protein SCO1/2